MKTTNYFYCVLLLITLYSCSTSNKSELVQQLEEICYANDFVEIPSTIFKAEDFGVVADGRTTNTQAIQKTIDTAHEAGGGIITLPKGIVLSGALFLKSNVEFRIDEGVTLKAVNIDAQYPDKWTRIAGIEMDWPAALINVYEQQNVRISGKGEIDGNGKYWWDKFWGDPKGRGGMYPEYQKKNLRWALDYDCKRVRPLVVYKSKNIHIEDIKIKRAGFWTVSLTYSSKVYVNGIVIRNNIGGQGPSTDGIDIDSSSDVLIENCDIDCNDDNICIKAGRDSDGLRVNIPTKNVVIRNCKTSSGHGLITLGSETSGGMHNIEVYNLYAKGTGTGFRIKSAKARGGTLSNIYIHDIVMDSVKNPFSFNLNWFPEYSYPPRPKDIPESEWPAHWHVMLTPVDPPELGIPEVKNIRIENVVVKNANTGFYAKAYAEKPMRNFTFKNVDIEAEKAGTLINVADWEMENVVFKTTDIITTENATNVDNPEYLKN